MSDTAEAIAQARKAVEPDKPKHVLRTLGHSIREYKKASILAPVFVAVEGILEILIPTIMASLIDEGITGGSMPATVKFGVILLVCAMVSLGAGFLSGKYAAVAGAGFAKNLRKDQFEKVQGFSFANIDRFSTGSIVTRLTTDVTNLQNAYMMIIRLGVRAPIMVVVAWLFSFRISPSISMVFLACIPILAIGLCGLVVLVHPVFERVFHTYDALNNVVDENLQGIRVVKSYNRESFEVSKFGRISQRIFKDFTKAERIMSFNIPGFRRANLPGAAGGKHGAEPGSPGDRYGRWLHRVRPRQFPLLRQFRKARVGRYQPEDSFRHDHRHRRRYWFGKVVFGAAGAATLRRELWLAQGRRRGRARL